MKLNLFLVLAHALATALVFSFRRTENQTQATRHCGAKTHAHSQPMLSAVLIVRQPRAFCHEANKLPKALTLLPGVLDSNHRARKPSISAGLP
jgi:hypothetical protein